MLLADKEEHDYIKQLVVLYTEDDQEALASLSAILKKRVKHLYSASDGEKGLEIFKRHSDHIDVIITDIRMPFLNGINMVEAIRKINPHVKVIYISAHNESEVLVQAINAGADGYIVKPISVKTRLMSKLFQISKDIHKNKLLDKYTQTIKLILDCVDNIIIISNGKNMISCNKTFLEFTNLSSFDDFKLRYKCICELFLNESGFIKADYIEDKTWIDVSLEIDEPKVKMTDKNGKILTFLVQVNPIFVQDDNPIYVIEFVDITKLNKKK
jgi:two-component system cell cycle response regulator